MNQTYSMKINTYQKCILGIIFLFLSSTIFGQHRSSDITHLTVVSDGNRYGSCEQPLNSIDTIELIFSATNLPNEICSPLYLQVYEPLSGTVLGTSKLIGFSNPFMSHWTPGTFPTSMDTTCRNNHTLFQQHISIRLNFFALPQCNAFRPSGDTQFFFVKYRLLDPGGNIYYDDTCFDSLFPFSCFPDFHLLYPDFAHGELCYKCSKVNIDGPDGPGGSDHGQGIELQVNNQNNSKNSEPHVQLQASLFNQFTLYPNPLKDQLFIDLEVVSSEATVYQFHLSDLSGQLIQTQQQRLERGFQTIELNTTQLAKGIYLLQVWNGKNWQAKKIVKM